MSMSESGPAKPRACDPPKTTATTLGTFWRASVIALSVSSLSADRFSDDLSTPGIIAPGAFHRPVPFFRQRGWSSRNAAPSPPISPDLHSAPRAHVGEMPAHFPVRKVFEFFPGHAHRGL